VQPNAAKTEDSREKVHHAAPPDFTRASQVIAGGEVDKAIDDAFAYHAFTQEQTARGNEVRHALALAVKVIVHNVPPCPDRSAAIRKIREARMDANSAIANAGRY
jgi:hypothetical protein